MMPSEKVKVETKHKPPRDVIVCTRRKNRPQVFVAVCWQCRYRENCKDFQRYVQPTLFDMTAKRNLSDRRDRGVSR